MVKIIPIDVAKHDAIIAKLPKPKLIIGAEMRDAGEAGVFIHRSNSTGRPLGEVPMGGARDIDDAVKAARAAFPAWRDMKPYDRKLIMERHCALIEAEMERFNQIAAIENGIPYSNFKYGHAERVRGWMRYYAGWADKIEGQVVGTNPSGHFEYTIAEPYGVVGHVITWNAPLLSLSMKIPACLAAGNTVVIKPAEFTPYTAQLFTELALEAGYPPGVINVVPGAVAAGEALVRHRDVDKISFTGGPTGARAIMRDAAETLKPLVFELGGKSANVIFSDVDLAECAPYCTMFGVSNSGQGCALPTRMIIHERIYDAFLDIAASTMREMSVGDPLNPATIIGPMVHETACARVAGVIDAARRERVGRFLVDGGRLDGALSQGCFIAPVLIADIDPMSPIAQTEVFGPALAAMKFTTEDEAVKLANNTAYGLSAYVQTHSLDIAHRMVRKLSAGTVYVNKATPSFHAAAPFGGNGISGFGREGGKAGLDEFIRIKGVGVSVQA
ncbi:MAG: aldehyde dehydrogenase [Hydrogenophilaceae bacterium]|jgi:aldehyde dehydrogenase (NAD+)|nr:aldehyde dehydrogenase [Hydrogenophilaceae bacterium]